jgi:hypothetical protein
LDLQARSNERSGVFDGSLHLGRIRALSGDVSWARPDHDVDRLTCRLRRNREALGEGEKAGLDSLTAGADGLLELLSGERQDPRARDGAEEHGADDAAGVLGDPREVPADESLRRGEGCFDESA